MDLEVKYENSPAFIQICLKISVKTLKRILSIYECTPLPTQVLSLRNIFILPELNSIKVLQETEALAYLGVGNVVDGSFFTYYIKKNEQRKPNIV